MHPPERNPRLFGRWSIDLIGPLPETVNGNRWIVAAIDDTSRWPEARALKEATTPNIIDFIYEEIVSRHGCPDEILTDRGANLMANLLEEYLRRLHITHLRTSAYHPRTNGLVERFNGVLGGMLSKACRGATHRWDQFLNQALLAYRVRKHNVTGYSPYHLVFGTEPTLPGDETPPYILGYTDPRDLAENRARAFESLDMDRRAAMERTKISQGRAKERHDAGIAEDPLTVGDWVIVRNFAKKKFEWSWLGPYQVADTMPFDTYRLKDPTGQIKHDLVHRERLKRFKIDPLHPPREIWRPQMDLALREGEDVMTELPDHPLNPDSP